jgi:hypothetical protein
MMQRLAQSVLIHYDARGTRLFLSHPVPGEARTAPKDCHPTSLQVEQPAARGIQQPATDANDSAPPLGGALTAAEVSYDGYTWTITDASMGEPRNVAV